MLHVPTANNPLLSPQILFNIQVFVLTLTQSIYRLNRLADPKLCNIVLQEVFKESKSLLFKSLRVQRLYDQQKNTVVYVLFNTRLDKNDDSNKSRFKSSLCAVSLDEGQLAADTPLAQQTTP